MDIMKSNRTLDYNNARKVTYRASITLATSVRCLLVIRGWRDVDGHAPADFLPLGQPHEEGALPKAIKATCRPLGKSSR
jgi:hypothetical protein